MERLLFKSISLLLFVLFDAHLILDIGDKCPLENGRTGICVAVAGCKYALELLIEGKRPINCGFIGYDPIVCCPMNLGHVKYGEKSKQECDKIYMNNAEGEYRPPIYGLVGGQKSEEGEYPHMVRLGIGQNRNNIEWFCGGSLISETFILTAAHCIHSRYGTINWARLGEATSFSTYEYIQVFRNILHPNYNAAYYYNDIALSELASKPKFSVFIGPACLHYEREIDAFGLIGLTVTGWGATEIAEGSKDLLKANVSLFTYEECYKRYPTTIRKLPKGIDGDSQFCAGGRNIVKDTCQGDSGGPIQIPYKRSSIFKTISVLVGVTSFGKVCGFENQPGVYVRIYSYLPWIEQVVWNASIKS